MKRFIQLTNGDRANIIPKDAWNDVVLAVSKSLYTGTIATALAGSSPSQQLINELLSEYFTRNPNGAIFVELTDVSDTTQPAIDTETFFTPTVARETVQIPSHSEYGKFYTVTLENGRAVSCECLGFTHRQQCRHLHEAERIARS